MGKKKKRRNRKKKAFIGGMIAICTFGLLYVGGAFYYKDKFFKGTKINGVSCDNLTAKDRWDDCNMYLWTLICRRSFLL